MKQRFWLFRRGPVFYLEDSETGHRESLKTRDPKEAERLRQARNDVTGRPALGLTLGRAYLAAYDPKLPERRWEEVMAEFQSKGRQSTRERYQRAMECHPFDKLRSKKILETTADELRYFLADGKPSTNHFLRRLHNLAVGMGWLPWPLIPAKLWPMVRSRKRRGISAAEHRLIIDAETNEERRNFYQLLWEIGAAQTDAALLSAENIDWMSRVLSYQRCKTGEWARLTIGPSLDALLRRLPRTGPLFPAIALIPASARSAEFSRRCRLLSLTGISLHSYRYAWAERALACGYPERWAQYALGHSSKAVHRAYAKAAFVICPPLEQYEGRQQRAPAVPFENSDVQGASAPQPSAIPRKRTFDGRAAPEPRAVHSLSLPNPSLSSANPDLSYVVHV